MSEQCKQLLLGNNCVETEIQCGQLVGNDSDLHGCKGSAGYTWCDAKQKCIRVWEEPCEGTLKESEALQIANAKCGKEGTLSTVVTFNPNSRTYWIDLTPNEVKAGCSPACVVYEENRSAEINWRCTGLLPSYTVKAANLSGLGEILTDGSGMSLYVFTADAINISNCAGTCEKNWPPLIVSGDITITKGISGSFGAISRSDGTIQVTYNGMPLYTYAADSSPGDVNGEGVGGKWFVAKTGMSTFPK
jgi:predicted lipoprotein with Yx(FWY)xxD motif